MLGNVQSADQAEVFGIIERLPVKTITSRHNAWFQRLRDAIRDHAEEIVIEGPKAVEDAVAGGWKPILVVHRGDELSAELFDALAETKTSQGVLALFERPRFDVDALLASDRLIVALDGVQDPGNVGTIVRLAAAFDAAGIVLLPGCADAFSPKSIRASAGAILHVPVANTTAEELIAAPRPLFAAEMSGSVDDLPPRATIVFGREGSGVSDPIRAAATPIAIRTSGRVESLNVAAAAAILLSRAFERK
jgi:TrmH family RNA methyltransferase